MLTTCQVLRKDGKPKERDILQAIANLIRFGFNKDQDNPVKLSKEQLLLLVKSL